MSNTIKLKRGSGSDPSASDLVVGELAIRTDSGKIFTKKDNGSVAEISGGGGIDDGDKGDITISNGGDTFTIDNGVVTSAKIADGTIVNADISGSAAIAGSKINPTFTTNLTILNTSPKIFLTDTDNNDDFSIRNENGTFKILDETNSADRFSIASNGRATFANDVGVNGNLDVGNGLDITGNITVSGTVDGVDIATRDTLFGGLTSSSGVLTNGVTATTQSAGNNTTRVATTAFVSTAISNLVDSSPSTLNTLNELAAALGDDANFSTTVTNSIATKMPLAGGQFTGNITFSGSQTVDGRDLSVDGAKLDTIESNATADQTAAEILTLIKTVDGAGSGLDADTLDGVAGSSYLTTANYDTHVCHLKTNVNSAVDQGASNEFTVNFNLEEHNDSGTFSHSSGVVTVLTTGWYRIYANMVYENTASSQRNTVRAYVKKNNTEIVSTRTYDYDRGSSYGKFSNNKIETMLYLSANDTIAICNYAYNEDGVITIQSEECEFIVNSVSVATTSSNADTVDSLHASSFIRSDADDTSTGILTLTSSSQYPLNINGSDNGKIVLQGSTGPYIRFREGTTDKAFIQWNSGGFLRLKNEEDGSVLRIKDDLEFSQNDSTFYSVFHEGNLTVGDGGLTQNNFTNADHSKLDGIESGATADQTAAEIRTLVGNASDSNVFTDALLSKLNGIAASATNVTNNNQLTNGAGYITATLTNEQVQDIVGGMVSSNTESGITVTYQDGDGTLDFSVASQTDNNFTNADHSKLDGIEAGATADQTASEILTLIKTVDGAGSGLDADTLDGISSASFLRSDASDTMTGTLTIGDGSAQTELHIKKADNNVSDHLQFYNGTTRVGEIGCEDTTWLRINQETNKNIYTPRYIRADNGFFVDGTSKGINGSGNFIGGTIAGASDYSTLLRSDAADTASGDITFSGGAGAATIAANSDISLSGGTSWSGNHTKLQHHSNYLYIVGGSSGIVFRENATDRWIIDTAGHLDPASDSTYDIGASGTRVRNIYADTLYGDGSNLTGISAGATGGGSDEVFYENDQTVTTNYTITNGKNAMAAGPITINSGATVTVGSGETLTIV